MWITTHLPTSDEWKAELVLWTVCPQSGHLLTIDRT